MLPSFHEAEYTGQSRERLGAALSRRHVMRTTLLHFAYLCSAAPDLVGQSITGVGRSSSLKWSTFLRRLEQTAQQQHAITWNQTGYVREIAELVKRVPLRAVSASKCSSVPPLAAQPAFNDLLHTADVQVSLISFAKGQFIPHHDHPAMTGVMVCAVGGVEVYEYDPLGAPATGFQVIRSCGHETLHPGDVSTLTAMARNIHFVRAMVDSQLIDIFTPPYTQDRIDATRWFEVNPTPLGGTGDRFRAYPYRGR